MYDIVLPAPEPTFTEYISEHAFDISLFSFAVFIVGYAVWFLWKNYRT